MTPRSVDQASTPQARSRGSGKTAPQRARRQLTFALGVASPKEVDHYVALLVDEVGLFKVRAKRKAKGMLLNRQGDRTDMRSCVYWVNEGWVGWNR